MPWVGERFTDKTGKALFCLPRGPVWYIMRTTKSKKRPLGAGTEHKGG